MREALLLVFAGSLALTPGCVCRDDPDRPLEVDQDGQRFLLCGRVADDGGSTGKGSW
jgi:hypothetical protein